MFKMTEKVKPFFRDMYKADLNRYSELVNNPTKALEELRKSYEKVKAEWEVIANCTRTFTAGELLALNKAKESDIRLAKELTESTQRAVQYFKEQYRLVKRQLEEIGDV